MKLKWAKFRQYKKTYNDNVTRRWYVYRDNSGFLKKDILVSIEDVGCKSDEFILNLLHRYVDVMGEPYDVRVSLDGKTKLSGCSSVTFNEGLNYGSKGKFVWFLWKWKGLDIWFMYAGTMRYEGHWSDKHWCEGLPGYFDVC